MSLFPVFQLETEADPGVLLILCEQRELGPSKKMRTVKGVCSAAVPPLSVPLWVTLIWALLLLPGNLTLQMETLVHVFGEMSTVANVISPDCVGGL